MTDEEEMEIERLQREVEILKGLCYSAYSEFTEARTTADNKRATWKEYKLNYEEADRKLAEIDGRLEVVSSRAKKTAKPIEPIVLTMDQIKSIAEKVGIKLDLEGDKP